MMTESFGMQLDDDSLLALFYVYDPHGTGSMPYEPFVQKLMHPDYFGFYVDNVDITQAKVDMEATQSMMDTLSRSVAPNLGDLRNVLAGLDTDGTGYLPLKTLLSGVASIGIILHDKELAVIMAKVDRDAAGNISYESFCHLFA